MKQAVAYCRVSTLEQANEDKFGIEFQKKIINDYCAKSDIEITDWFVDTISGAKDNRPEFNRLLSGAVKNPPIEMVVVAKTDRIARDINLFYAYKLELIKRDIKLVSATESINTGDAVTSMILENFLAVIAEVERENIKCRTAGGRAIKSAKGGYSGGKAPYGYKVSNGSLVINEPEVPLVKRIFELRDSGSTMKNICETLKVEGFKNRKGTDFAISTIQYVLGNRKTYQGYYKYSGDEWVKGQQEPILKGE